MVRILLLLMIALLSTKARGADISWDGFASIYYGQALNSELLPYRFNNKNVNFTSFSLIGTNLSGKIGENLTAAAQFVGLGYVLGTTDPYTLLVQWASINFTPAKNTLIKGGRQLIPVFISSEYVHVGYLVPFRQIPTPVYLAVPQTRFDGASAYLTLGAEENKLTVGLFGGTPLIDTLTTGTLPTYANLFGLTTTLSGNGWQARAAAFGFYFGEVVAPNAIPTVPEGGSFSGHVQTYTFGYRYDKHRWVSWGEYALVRTPDGSPTGNGGRLAGNSHSFYLLGGYRIGDFMPRYTFSQGTNTYGLYNSTLTTHTLGINFQPTLQAIIKIEYELDLVPAPGAGGITVKQPPNAVKTFGSAFFAGVDVIF